MDTARDAGQELSRGDRTRHTAHVSDNVGDGHTAHVAEGMAHVSGNTGSVNAGVGSIGRKDDAWKPRWSLVPWAQVGDIVKVLTNGAEKYNDNNWKKVSEPIDRYTSAMMRHITAWASGEETDKEWGLPHLAHAGCCLLFLMWFDKERKKASVLEIKPEGTADSPGIQ